MSRWLQSAPASPCQAGAGPSPFSTPPHGSLPASHHTPSFISVFTKTSGSLWNADRVICPKLAVPSSRLSFILPHCISVKAGVRSGSGGNLRLTLEVWELPCAPREKVALLGAAYDDAAAFSSHSHPTPRPVGPWKLGSWSQEFTRRRAQPHGSRENVPSTVFTLTPNPSHPSFNTPPNLRLCCCCL